MKRAIEFEQEVKLRHRIIVELENEADIDMICDLSGMDFNDILYQLNEFDDVKILEKSENFYEDIASDVQYYDDYWTKDEIKYYGDSD